MDVNEDHVQTLMNMGFPSESEIRRALKLGKNDLNEAVAILTNEHPSNTFDAIDDVEMKDVGTRGSDVQGPVQEFHPPLAPPSYDDVVETDKDNTVSEATTEEPAIDNSEAMEFPVTNLYELEGRVFTDQWSIPYKKEESLGKCLVASTRLAAEGLCETDDNCVRFMDRCMPEALSKLMTSGAVHRWGSEIQDGIYNMCQLFVDLAATRLVYEPVPINLLEVLAMALNPGNEFHYKNRFRKPEQLFWQEKYGDEALFSISNVNANKDPYGLLRNLINRFGWKKGFDHMKTLLAAEKLDAPAMSALLAPLGQCAEYLNGKSVQPMLATGMERAVKYVQGLKEDELKDKKVGCVNEMLASIKLLCLSIWPNDVQAVDTLRLDFALRMLKSPHFNARMNSLKVISKLIEDAINSKQPKTAIDQDTITDWLSENKILSVALEGNIDQVQYCERVKGIVDFLGSRLSLDELSKIWKMQDDETNQVIDNIHGIIAAAGVKFNTEQLEHLFVLMQKSWKDENDRMRDKLLSLIGKIGRDAKAQKTTTRVLELLWDLAHLPSLPTDLIEQALEEHLIILCDSCTVKEQLKKNYVVKCIEDIKKGVWVLPALKQLLHISKNIAKSSFHKSDKGFLHELNKNHDIIKLVTRSLVECHKLAVESACNLGTDLAPLTLIDGRYEHRDYMTTHLNFLQFILQEGVLYLHWHRAREIWETMAANPSACYEDMETCFEWFTRGISDLEADTQANLFEKEILRLDPTKISVKGFYCFKNFFEQVNLYDQKLRKSGSTMIVEKMDLKGIDYLWEVCLNTSDTEIAWMAIKLLLKMSYTELNAKLKKDPVGLHKKFTKECYSRLEAAMITMGGTAIAQTIAFATRIITAPTVPEVASVPSPSKSAKLLNIERLLLIAERYIMTVEDTHTTQRTILPHGTSFQGQPITLYISCESPKTDFSQVAHTNERLGSVRQKIATTMGYAPEQIQILANEKMLSQSKDQKVLHQLDFTDNQFISVRAFSSTVAVQNNQSKEGVSGASASKSGYELEQEKQLPGVQMAAMGGHVFDTLYQLADQDESRITSRVRELLQLIPTDPSVQDALDSIGPSYLRQPSPSPEAASPKQSPRASPRKYTFPSPQLSPKISPREIIQSLFDASSTDMSTFRVLYNLQVLSSKLMPVTNDIATIQSAKNFYDDFLNAGGLNLVINVLQRDAMPSDVGYETRQGCYAISLQLARYLLCGQTITGEEPSSFTRQPSMKSIKSTRSVRSTRSTRSKSASISSTSSLTIDVTPSAASKAIQTMGVQDFTETVACLMRVTWAAAAGRLHLVSSAQPIRESMSSMTGRRSRQSSTSSNTSTGSSESENQTLHAGVCVKQKDISPKDSNIAKEALELLVACLQMRHQLLASFYALPCVSDFIIDILVGATPREIRDAALEQLWVLACSEMSPIEGGHQQSPHQFILGVLLKARLPLWVTSCNTRGASQKMLSQCSQYFDLRCKLLDHLTADQQKRLQINAKSMLDDELDWLDNFVPSEHAQLRETDNMLLAGHIQLIKTLFTCEGVDKKSNGPNLINNILGSFLFPAAKAILTDVEQANAQNVNGHFIPKCSDEQSKKAAYQLLIELADQCSSNLDVICHLLLDMHHQFEPETAHNWEYEPPVDGRPDRGFVGLKNAGATCYMNSVLQQLYMQPGIHEAILTSEDGDTEDEDTVFYQIQQMFGHLMDSKLQYHEPEKFWKLFKLWGQVVNVREQQDAFDFYTALTDQLDEHLKKIGRDQIFKKKFGGIYSDQKICQDCPHRYEREEPFFALNLTVKNATLEDSLDQFVMGELLDGDNAYFCEKCGEKRNTVKRMCIKTLPPTLCIQLKRFGYDWEANRALKFDDYFKFPWVLDMEPYTAEGMARLEEQEKEEQNQPSTPSKDGTSGNIITTGARASMAVNYELVGVVVHSGQANAGHYYSFIKERRGTSLTNENKGKWFKFNDQVVEEFDLNDETLEAECFGGTYRAKVYDQSSSYPEERQRYWNGYLLFYERMEEIRTPVSAKKSKITMFAKREHKTPGRSSDSLRELSELVHKGEKRGIFSDSMPARIQRGIRDENLKFMKNKNVYNDDYFTFMKDFVSRNSEYVKDAAYTDMCLQSLQLGIHFLFNTYLKTKRKKRLIIDEWVNIIDTLVYRCKAACNWLVQYLAIEQGKTYIKPFLLECPNKDVRVAFSRILEQVMSSYFKHKGVATHKCFDELLEILLSMLKKDVEDNIKTCTQYFWLLSMYVHQGTKACAHMFGRNGFVRLVNFLLGPQSKEPESPNRRWSSMQSRDFGYLHEALATLILNCDVSGYRTDDPGKYPERKPSTSHPTIFLKMSTEMHKKVFGDDSSRYVREVILAVREMNSSLSVITDMILYCCYCNAAFTMAVLRQIMLQYTNAPSNELKNLFSVLSELLSMEDPLQMKRLQCIIDGYIDETNTNYEGMLAVVKINHNSDSRRSYQCIKFLVALTNKCTLAKDYLIQTPTKWQWAVNWLKKKMSEYSYWTPQSTCTTSNEDSGSKSFQRTISAQDTLAEATALLTEFENHENGNQENGNIVDMDINGSSPESNETSTEEVSSQDSTETIKYTPDEVESDRL
ncbi:unnamed protein product [Owenia fusiformis]|uniref:Ubiquitinyl hydrolase 1 n=1 Tax=Owenia fusiformis TaxID=6347 RepID=A0A8J1U824_OWEFU|nr:unnamed protein product [Owenia fusiformis]